jgi:spore germination cell wall hydrolase CwlJ-like protein
MTKRVAARLTAALAIGLACTAQAQARKQHTAPKPKSDRECLARAMYFESARTEEDGMLAVGTVVANRLESGRYGDTVCEVVAAPAQFAPGVLSRKMAEPRPAELAIRVAEAVLAGARHPVAEDAKFFHTANVPFRKGDKRYVLVSGGNAFYKWNRTDQPEIREANAKSLDEAFAKAPEAEAVGERTVAIALNPAETPPAEQPAAPVVAAAPSIAPTLAAPAAALAFAETSRAASTPEAQAALATVAAVEKRPRPRVIVPAAPVQASAGPAWSVFGKSSLSAGPLRAIQAVRDAWSAFR